MVWFFSFPDTRGGGGAPSAPGLGISPPRRRASFWVPRKKPKRHQGWAQRDRTGCAGPAPMSPTPWTPCLRGPPIRLLLWFSQRRGWLGIDVASPTAAAAWVGFPAWWFLHLNARLCVRWGTSCAVGRGAGGDLHHLGALTAPQEAREGNPPSFDIHRTRAQWPGGDWDHPLKLPRAGTAPPGIRRVPS